MRTISILGTEYTIDRRKIEDDPKLSGCNGYLEPQSKKIIISDVATDNHTIENLDGFINQVMRHEIVHAFFLESGLDDYCANEQLVDWIAYQAPKMQNLFTQLDINGNKPFDFKKKK